MSEQKELIAPAPHNCPGTQSEDSGKASACQGCPNQQVCATGPKGPDPDLAEIVERLANVKHKILVLSGKGGVGKSTFSTLLSQALAMKTEELQVGLLDIDICGPSIPMMVGVQDEQVHHSNSGWSPVSVKDNLVVMSVGFLLSDQNDAVIWRGPKKNDLIKKFLKEVDWGTLDYLILDTPPGTSDEHLSAVSYLKNTNITGAVVITTPQEVSLMDVRKEINFCKKTGVPIIGVVENMSTFVCPKCNKETKIFAPTTGGAEKMAKDMEVPFLGRVPLDPRIAKSCDQGKNFLEEWPETEAAKSYFKIVDEIIQKTNKSDKKM